MHAAGGILELEVRDLAPIRIEPALLKFEAVTGEPVWRGEPGADHPFYEREIQILAPERRIGVVQAGCQRFGEKEIEKRRSVLLLARLNLRKSTFQPRLRLGYRKLVEESHIQRDVVVHLGGRDPEHHGRIRGPVSGEKSVPIVVEYVDQLLRRIGDHGGNLHPRKRTGADSLLPGVAAAAAGQGYDQQ